MPIIYVILGLVFQLAIVALAVSERRRRRRAEPLVAVWVLRAGSVWVVLVVVSPSR